MQKDGIKEIAYNGKNPKELKKYNERVWTIAKEEYFACLCIAQLHEERYGNLKKLFVINGLKGDVT